MPNQSIAPRPWMEGCPVNAGELSEAKLLVLGRLLYITRTEAITDRIAPLTLPGGQPSPMKVPSIAVLAEGVVLQSCTAICQYPFAVLSSVI